MSSRSGAPDRKRQLTVDDSSEEEVSDLVNSVVEDDDDEDNNENGELGELEEEDDEDDDIVEEEEDESVDENEPDEEEADEEEDDVPGEDDDEPSLDDGEDGEDGDDNDDFDESGVIGSTRRMTARQRNKQLGTTANIGVVDLDDLGGSNRSKKKALSAEEQRIKRAEMARRRRNLSKQRLEEEKQDTLDKLLKKRAGKVRGDTDDSGEYVNKKIRSKLLAPHPAFMSWRSSATGFSLSMTEERAKKENLA